MATWSAWDGDAPPGANGARAGGVGLRNTAARLEQLYGASQRFSVGPHPQGGTLVEVRLPYHTNAGASGGSSRTPDEAQRAG
jgi:LytS/YehU family sensor histidine kinase